MVFKPVDGGYHGVSVKASGPGEIVDRLSFQTAGTEMVVTGSEGLSANGTERMPDGGKLLAADRANGPFD